MAFGKILIANRGEIACRIARTAHEMGYRTVAVHSEADADAPHVEQADQAVAIGPAPVADSYLNQAAILRAAALSGADALHPGYGFLAENAEFAKACVDAGLTFIGPGADAIQLMGNKRLAKLRMQDAGVPCVPGYSGEEQDDQALIGKAAEIGFPIMVKAAAGGGGRGMRLVQANADLANAIAGARSEAENAFGSGELILEKAVTGARHVEIQVFADSHGNAIHLGERDCSVQRRHQKVIEEAPSPALNEGLRARMGDAAVAAAKAIGYVGAGTVEFLLAADGEFYFLEMNTRLQVEHPVTEKITGLDLVAWQLDVAQGGVLPLRQDQVALNGHAIEVRLYAEDPANGFLPQTGRIAAWHPAQGVRTDTGIAAGQEISSFYDPMVAKIIAHGGDREEARRKLIRALEDTVLLGIASNKDFLIEALRHPRFAAGEADTDFIGNFFPPDDLTAPAPDARTLALAAALIFRNSTLGGTGWRSAAPAKSSIDLRAGEDQWAVTLTPDNTGCTVTIGEDECRIEILGDGDNRVRFRCDGLADLAAYAFDGGQLFLDLAGRGRVFHEQTAEMSANQAREGDGQLLAPMAGRIASIRAEAGANVARGEILLILEAMKMEHEIKADVDGAIEAVMVKVGDQVDPRQLLVSIKGAESEAAE